MDWTHEAVAHFSKTWGLIYLVALSLGVAAYAFWPGNKGKFDHAAQIPLEDGDTDNKSSQAE